MVQALVSSQGLGPPLAQIVPMHKSPLVHGLPSSQLAPLAGPWEQPLLAAQVSSVHALPSLQLSAGPPLHVAPLQKSLTVHGLPSVHTARPLALWTQPFLGSQASAVQVFKSSQETRLPGVQVVPLHQSPVVQVLPSSQGKAPLASKSVASIRNSSPAGFVIAVLPGLPGLTKVQESVLLPACNLPASGWEIGASQFCSAVFTPTSLPFSRHTNAPSVAIANCPISVAAPGGIVNVRAKATCVSSSGACTRYVDHSHVAPFTACVQPLNWSHVAIAV